MQRKVNQITIPIAPHKGIDYQRFVAHHLASDRMITVRVVVTRDRKGLGAAVKAVSPNGHKWIMKKYGQMPLGVCIPKYPAGTKDPVGKGYDEFIVVVSGRGLGILDTLIHELVHVGYKAYPGNEERCCQLVACFSAKILPWLVKDKPKTNLTRVFVSDRLSTVSKLPIRSSKNRTPTRT